MVFFSLFLVYRMSAFTCFFSLEGMLWKSTVQVYIYSVPMYLYYINIRRNKSNWSFTPKTVDLILCWHIKMWNIKVNIVRLRLHVDETKFRRRRAWDRILGHQFDKKNLESFASCYLQSFYWQIFKENPRNKKTRVHLWKAFCRKEKWG